MSKESEETSIPVYPGLVRNFMFVGSTGAGKSSSCNTICRSASKQLNNKEEPEKEVDPFPVGHEEISCTKTITQHVIEPKRMNLIDTPDFSDHRLNETKLSEIFSTLELLYSDLKERNSRQIDAFILVVRLSPRAQTLKADLQKLKTLFGAAAIRSMIMLLIYPEDEKNEGKDFLKSLFEMGEVLKLLREGKGEEPNENWFCVWNNKHPRKGQEEELLDKISKLQPYTRSELSESVSKFKQHKHIKNANMRECESNAEMMSTMEELDDRLKHIDANKRRPTDDSILRLTEVLELKHLTYLRQLDDFLLRNNESIERFMFRVDKLQQEEKEQTEKKKIKDLILDLICRRRKLEDEETKELVGLALRKGTKEAAESGAEELAKYGAKKIAKEVPKLVLKGACNIF